MTAGADARPQVDALVDLRVVLRRYGLLTVEAGSGRRGDGWFEFRVKARPGREALTCVVADGISTGGREGQAAGDNWLFDLRDARWYRRRTPAYRALLPFRTLQGADFEPVWIDAQGRAVIAWQRGRRTLWIGLSLTEEIVRNLQGDPTQVGSRASRARFGFEWERPNFLYEAQVVPGYETEPWADRLGFAVAELLAEGAGLPLVDPIPHGGYGAILITGDDDQALLERYAKQLDVIGDLPITYYLHYLTRHTPETIAALPPNVDFGVHPDAIEAPERYTSLCLEQSAQIRQLCGRPARTVRNHGFLNAGYLGHLHAWELAGLALDLNYPGVDGTALTGSLLPFRVRRPDGTWSQHFSLLTVLGDGMQEALKWTPTEAAARVWHVARQVERRRPALLVINLHPMNIITTEPLHRAVVALGHRRGWTALSAEGLLDWLQRFDDLELSVDDGVALISPRTIEGVSVRLPARRGWKRVALPPWAGACVLP